MKWDLSVLYQGFDDPAIEKDFAKVKELNEQMKNLLENPGSVRETLEKYESMSEQRDMLGGKLGEFASLTMSTDATSEPAMLLMDRLMKFSVEESLVGSKFSRYVKNLTDEEFDQAIESSEELKKVEYALRHYARAAAEHLPARLVIRMIRVFEISHSCPPPFNI